MSELLEPASQCMVALMAAFGARFGIGSSVGSSAGQAGRAGMTQALMKRGLDMLQENQILITPSKRGVAALLLAKGLLGEMGESSPDMIESVRPSSLHVLSCSRS
jgi:hypothetical protein